MDDSLFTTKRDIIRKVSQAHWATKDPILRVPLEPGPGGRMFSDKVRFNSDPEYIGLKVIDVTYPLLASWCLEEVVNAEKAEQRADALQRENDDLRTKLLTMRRTLLSKVEKALSTPD